MAGRNLHGPIRRAVLVAHHLDPIRERIGDLRLRGQRHVELCHGDARDDEAEVTALLVDARYKRDSGLDKSADPSSVALAVWDASSQGRPRAVGPALLASGSLSCPRLDLSRPAGQTGAIKIQCFFKANRTSY